MSRRLRWLDANRTFDERVLFVTGANWGGPDGCEIGEQYLAIWPAERKAHASTNE
jgi:hypothetical protein